VFSLRGLAAPKIQSSHDSDVTRQYTSFEYDDAGNITETKLFTDTSTVVETRTYNDVNEITANSVDDGISVVNWTYGHDANGNLTSRSDGTDTWDDENRLIEVENNSTTQATYQYDSNSRLTQRGAVDTTTNYTWAGWDLVKEEKTGTINETTRYAVPQGMVTSFDRNGSRYYLHGDGLSSTQLVTNSSGSQAARVVYGAWGDTLSANDSVPGGLDVRFVGGLGVRNDSTTGLIYMRHRWYDAGVLGRFISRDPIGHRGGLNLYSYSSNNPVTFTDHTGLFPGRQISVGLHFYWLFQKAQEQANKQKDRLSKIEARCGEDFTAAPPYFETGLYAGDESKRFYFVPGTIPNKLNGRSTINVNLNLGDDPGFNTNCHGYSLTDGKYWLEPSDVVEALLSLKYLEQGKGYKPQVGDIVLYDRPNDPHGHSATVVQTSPEILVRGISGNNTEPVTTTVERAYGGGDVTYTYWSNR